MSDGMSMDEARQLMEQAKKLGIPKNPCVPAPIGTGPAGETCGTCRHRVYSYSNTSRYQKCELCKASWTHGAGSDIKAKWPACSQWEAKK